MKPESMSKILRVVVTFTLVAGMAAALASSRQASARTAQERIDSGRRIYLSSCSMCHGDQGMGDGPLSSELVKEAGTPPARLNDAAKLAALGRVGVRKIIVEGGGHRNRSNLMPAWGDKLTPIMADDVTDFVMSLPGLSPAIPAATLDKYLKAPPGSPVEGKRLFVYYCSGCHGLSGHGDGVYAKTLRQRDKVWPRNLTQTAYFATKTDKDLYVAVSLGGGHIGKSTMMPAWSSTLTPAQIKHLVSYVRALSRTPSKP
jgi:mono/diheme cytochrome c family protein